MLSNTLRLNCCYFKIIHILHPRFHPKIIGQILKDKQKSKRLIIMKVKMKMKKRSHRCNISRPRCRHGHKYSKYLKGRNFRGKKISRVSRISLEFAKLNSREKFEFSKFAKLNSREKFDFL